MLSVRRALFFVVIAGCGASEAPASPPPCPGGDARAIDEDEVAALVACTEITGDVVIDGAALRNIDALVKLERIDGSLTVGPTLRLTSVGGLRSLRSVGKDLDVRSNQQLGGVFLGALVDVGGDVFIDRNRSAETVSLHHLETVGGNLEISGNAGLLRVDLSVLASVGGDLLVDGNRQLDDVVIAEAKVAGERAIQALHP